MQVKNKVSVSFLLMSLGILTAASCSQPASQPASTDTPAPTASTTPQSTSPPPPKPSAPPERQTKMDQDSFTLRCAGDYNFKPKDGELSSGTFSFSITIEPREGRSFMTGLEWGPNGTRNITDLNNEVLPLYEISNSEIQIGDGDIIINRDTGKISEAVMTTVTGMCNLAEQKIPIPSKRF
jgi:hypothetical protein